MKKKSFAPSASLRLSDQKARLRTFDKSWTVARLANGLRVVHVPRPQDQRFYLGATVRVGSRYETNANLGISHFLEHMMFRGSRRYPTFRKLAEAFEWLGGEWNAGTGQEHTEYWYSGSSQSMNPALKLFFEFLLYPRLNDIDVERKIIFREIEGELNEFGLITDLDYHTHRMMWPKSTLANPIMGTKESLGKLNVRDLNHYRQKHYRPDNMTVVLVGGKPSDGIIKKIDDAFNSYKPGHNDQLAPIEKLKPFKGPKAEVIRHPDNEYFVQLSFRTMGEWHRDSSTYDLISRILSDGFCSRLCHRIREQLGMVYDIDTEVTLFSDTGSLDIYAHVSLDMLTPFIKETAKILRKLCDKGPSIKELERAKRRSITDIELLPSDPDHLGFKLGWGVLNDKRPSFERGFDIVGEKSPSDIQDICNKVFKASRCALAVLGPDKPGLADEMRTLLSKVLP